MARFIVQLRRGSKDDWKKYEQENSEESKPREGELVVEYETINEKKIPRLKIGDGQTPYSELPYILIDSFTMPKPNTINLYASKWVQVSDNVYVQDITEQLKEKTTSNSKIDLQPTPEQLRIFHQKDVTFTIVNEEDDTINIYAVGIRPSNDYEKIQVTITEVATDG